MSAYIGTPTDDYSASFTDPSISDQSISIGPVLLDGWEIPEKVTWGGAQRMTVHKQVGGRRTIDVMGQDHSEVSWSGRFLSQDAAFRADQLDLIRCSGVPVDVVFAGRYYAAVISNFVAEQITQFHIHYQISFTIQADESSVFPPPALPATVLVLNDLAAIASMVVAPPLLIAQAAAALIPPLVAPLAAFEVGAAATTAVIGAVDAVSAGVDAVGQAASATLTGLAAASVVAGTLAGAATVVGAVGAMQTAQAATFAMASTVSMASYIGRVAVNADPL